MAGGLYRKWLTSQPDEPIRTALQDELGLPGLLSDVLSARGVDLEMATEMLSEESVLPDPFLIRDMDKAVARIRKAIEEEEAMVIFGDYDVDGITATTLLYLYLESIDAEVYYKLPNRNTDDYGLVPSMVDQVADRGIGLIITVDNGTSALEAAQRAAQRGVDIIITDHHLPSAELPQVTALVNPYIEGQPAEFGVLSGVGVAFMLAVALEGCSAEELLPLFGDLVAVGTVADVMKLVGINRVLVRHGLQVLQDTQRTGLALLLESCGMKDKPILAENISYGIAPKLNAAGRMDDPTEAMHLLLAETEEEAQQLLDHILEQNLARQKAEQEIVEEIINQVQDDASIKSSRVIVVWGNDWHQGVVGIVASRLVDTFAKPSVVISFEGEEGRGSGRSLQGFSLHTALSSCEDLLLRFGGHDLAAGLSIQFEHVEELRSRLNEWANEHYPQLPLPILKADVPLRLSCLNIEELRWLEKLAPCGSGNPLPRFLMQNMRLDAVAPISNGRFCLLKFRHAENQYAAVYFNHTPEQFPYQVGEELDLIVVLSVYEGRFEPQVSMRALDVRPAKMEQLHVEQTLLFELFSGGGILSEEQCQLLKPSRDDVAEVYRLLRNTQAGISYLDMRSIFNQLGEERTGRVLSALSALEELGLVGQKEETGRYEVLPTKEKRNLEDSELLKRLGGVSDGKRVQ